MSFYHIAIFCKRVLMVISDKRERKRREKSMQNVMSGEFVFIHWRPFHDICIDQSDRSLGLPQNLTKPREEPNPLLNAHVQHFGKNQSALQIPCLQL